MGIDLKELHFDHIDGSWITILMAMCISHCSGINKTPSKFMLEVWHASLFLF